MGISSPFKPAGIVIALIFMACRLWCAPCNRAGRRRKGTGRSRHLPGRHALATFTKVILPSITRMLTGFAMAFARAVGEYGSVIFIAGNMPMVSEIRRSSSSAKLEQYDYAGATAVAVVMLVISFILLLIINALQAWQRRAGGPQHDGANITVRRAQAGTTEAPWVRYMLIALALAFMLLFLVLPLAARVCRGAAQRALGAYLEGLRRPDAWSAIKLT